MDNDRTRTLRSAQPPQEPSLENGNGLVHSIGQPASEMPSDESDDEDQQSQPLGELVHTRVHHQAMQLTVPWPDKDAATHSCSEEDGHYADCCPGPQHLLSFCIVMLVTACCTTASSMPQLACRWCSMH